MKEDIIPRITQVYFEKKKKTPTVPNRSRAQDLSIGSLDAFPLSYRTFVAGKAFLTNFLHTASARIGS